MTTSEIVDDLADELRGCLGDHEDWFSSYARSQRDRIAFDLDLAEQHFSREDRILDVGSAPFLTTAGLHRLGFDIQGVDLNTERFADAIDQLGIRVAQCDIENEPLPFPDAAFDAVLFNELFEHLRIDPIFTLGEVHRVLRPTGKLFVSTPNGRSFRSIVNYLLHNSTTASSGSIFSEYRKLHTLGHMGHVREYTTREVADFLGELSFRVESVLYRGWYRGVRRRLTSVPVAARAQPFFTMVLEKS